jgi:hypothetical protein
MELMSNIYRIVPNDFQGNILYPLSALKEKHPEIHAMHVKKYEHRKHVTELFIPQLNCYWGDVIHFSAVHPDVLVKALREAGFEEQFSFYEIDPSLLDSQKALVYINKIKEDKNHLTAEDFTEFNPAEVGKWAYIPEETTAYYRKKLAEGKKPVPFLFIPHILYKGSIEVSGMLLKKTG